MSKDRRKTVKESFDKFGGKEEKNPLERLRFFCSLAMEGSENWLDVEEFFDDIENNHNKQIDALRGQLQNCANLLHRLKRHGYSGDAVAADAAINSANRVLYESLHS